MYRFNGADGAITCDGCSTIIRSNITLKDYRETSSGYDYCPRCLSGLKVTDNFDAVLDMIDFQDRDEFYFLQIIQRKKDGNITQIGNNGYRTIKTYYIFSKEQLQKKKDKIVELCIKNNARAYISVNKRNAKEVALAAIQQYAQLVSEGNSYQGYRVYDSACGATRARGYKALWIVDVDSKEPEYLNTIIKMINECRGTDDNKVKYQMPTVHGYHLITSGFDTKQLSQKLAIKNMDSIDIQKDNPTLLYYATV